VHLHHNATVHLKAPRTQYAYDLQVPLRKMVECRTRDLHQSLLVKLNRALTTQGKSGGMTLEGARSLRPFPHHPALEGTGQISPMTDCVNAQAYVQLAKDAVNSMLRTGSQ